jgi:zinc transport system substrate-binding protein
MKIASLALALAALSSVAAAQPRVVTSFAPVQSVAAGVMEGVAVPETLIRGGASPHSYSLRPSEAKLLESADLIVWVGPVYESFLVRPLRNLGGKARRLAWTDVAGVSKLKARSGGVWESDDHGHSHGHTHAKDAIDGHLFLDPSNAKALATALAGELAKLDPANAARYAANAARVAAGLDALDAELAATLKPLADRPFVVFHDAFQYFEARYGLAAAGSITVSPERRPGAQRLQRIRDKVRSAKAACVFAEPQFEPSLVRTVVEGTNARIGTLDYVGVGVAPGPDAYAAIMRGLARGFSECLSAR